MSESNEMKMQWNLFIYMLQYMCDSTLPGLCVHDIVAGLSIKRRLGGDNGGGGGVVYPNIGAYPALSLYVIGWVLFFSVLVRYISLMMCHM